VVSYDGKLDVPGRMLVADNFGISKRLAHHHGMWVVSFIVTKRSALVVLLAVLTHIYDLESFSMEFTLICMLEFRSAYHICFILRVRLFARVLQD